MKHGKSTQKNSDKGESNPVHGVVIVGRPKLQNTLLADYLRKAAGVNCSCRSDFEWFSLSSAASGQCTMILWDCLDNDMEQLWNRLSNDLRWNPAGIHVALLNVRSGLGLEKNAMRSDVRGVFYEKDSPEIFLKGVQAIFNGELWFSRKILAGYVKGKERSHPPDPSHWEALTPREKEILAMIGSGATNEDIVRELCISRHTVKTHIYNIYKKVNASNRTQAALWAARNI